MSKSPNDWLDRVYTSNDLSDLEKAYDGWADKYDADLSSFGYRLPSVMIGYICSHLRNRKARILDAGAGTGILGEILSNINYGDITAIDMSQGMLDCANRKGAYRDSYKMKLGERLDFSDNSFDAVISSGTFTKGHAPSNSFEELIRITKNDGHVIFSIRSDADGKGGYQENQDRLEKEGLWKLIESSEAFQSLPWKEPEVENKVFVYKVL